MPKYHPHHLNEDNFKLSSEALAMIIGTAIIAGISGYMIGIASSLGLIPNPFVTKPVRKRGLENYSDEEESGDEDIDEAVTIDHAPNWANGFEADQRAGLRDLRPTKGFKEPVAEKKAVAEDTPSWENSKEDCKLVLVVRTDLGMTKGMSLSKPYDARFLTLQPRQDRSSSFPRDPRLLQELPPKCTQLEDSSALGKGRPSQDRRSS